MDSNSDNNNGAVARLPCRQCHGRGYLEVAQCIAWTRHDRRCTLPSRAMTDPDFLANHPHLNDLPPDFTAYCGLHGNALMRQRKLARLVAEQEERAPF